MDVFIIVLCIALALMRMDDRESTTSVDNDTRNIASLILIAIIAVLVLARVA